MEPDWKRENGNSRRLRNFRRLTITGVFYSPAKPGHAVLPVRHYLQRHCAWDNPLGRNIFHGRTRETGKRSDYVQDISRLDYGARSQAELRRAMEHKFPASAHVQFDSDGWLYRLAWRPHV